MRAILMRTILLLSILLLLAGCAPAPPRALPPDAALMRQVGQRVELRGTFGGLGKDGWFMRHEGVPVFLVGAGPLATGRVGAPVRVRGLLRYDGDPQPTGCGGDGQPCPVVAGREGFTLTDASVEFEP